MGIWYVQGIMKPVETRLKNKRAESKKIKSSLRKVSTY